MTTNGIGSMGLGGLAVSPLTGKLRDENDDSPATWFEALASAWGRSLDGQADRIADMSDVIGNQGVDNPSAVSKLTAESLRMSFMANSSSSSIDSVGKALETMARKG